MWLAVTCLLIALGIKLITGRKGRGRFPPGPRGLPLVGNILDLKRLVEETKFHYRAWNRLAESYGAIVGLKLGLSEPMIIVSGKEAVTEILNREEFDGRPDGFIFRHRTQGVRRGVIFTDGTIWKEQRRFAVKNLREFGFGKRTMENMIVDEALTLVKIIERKSKSRTIRNVNKIATVAVLNSLWCLTSGIRYDQEKEDAGLEEMLQTIDDVFKDSDVSGGIITYFPFLRYLIPVYSGFNARNERQNRLWDFFGKFVAEHKISRKKGSTEEPRDLIDAYLAEIESQPPNSESSFNEPQLIALVKDLFTAGVETTSNTVGFGLLYLVANQTVQEKIHEEIDRVIGRDSPPTLEMQNRMPYLNATIAEVFRLSNVGPTTIPHRAMADTELLGYEIKKNYVILPNLHSVHNDKSHWGDPENFRPERFLDENGNFQNDPWVMSFSAGRRKCPGEKLARNSLFLFLSCLLQKFRFESPHGETIPSLDGVNGFTISPPNFNAVAVIR
ncbi:methyl farnesoate epoxidase-like [Athalia rosae]|uniref:methyl farnesoate epoxidase-like n=1 Tax=Athalia rosae TaxID=37344 RepID=UPI002033A9BD|nr:methyl farnesoate epoxidase-like [Athalia rosae]